VLSPTKLQLIHIDDMLNFKLMILSWSVFARKRFPRGAVHKLHNLSAGPFKILRRLGTNAYHIELPFDLQISHIFNVEDLIAYTPHFVDAEVPVPPLNITKGTKPRDEIEAILEDQIVSTCRGGYRKFLVQWKNRPLSDCSWLWTEEVQRLHPDLYEAYITTNSSELSSFPMGGN